MSGQPESIADYISRVMRERMGERVVADMVAPPGSRIEALCAEAIDAAERGDLSRAVSLVTDAARSDCTGAARDAESIDRALRLVELWSRVWRRS